MEENKVAVKNEKKTIPVRPDVMEFVSNSCDQEFIESFGFSISEATYDEENEELTFAIAQPTGKRGKKQMEEIENYLSQFTVKEIHVSRNLLINAKDEVDEKLANTMENFKNKVHATTDNDKLCILVTGKKKKLGKFQKAIQKELNELEKKKEVITMNISLDQQKLMLILSLGFEEQFESYSNIEVKIDPQNGILNLKGSQEMVHSAKLQALETYSKIKEEYVELSERQEDYLASGGLQKVNDSLRKSKVQALVCLDKSKPKKAKVELFDLEKFDNVKGYLSQQVSEKCFTVEEESVHLLKNDKWRKFRETLAKDSGIKVFTVGNVEVSIWLTGETKQVEEAYENLKSFMKINTVISESVVVNHGVSRHLTKYCENKIRNVEKRLEEHLVKIYFKEDRTFLISGTKEGVNQAKNMLQDIIDDLAHQKIPVEKPGMRKYLTTTAGRTSLTGIETRYNCTIHLTNDSEQRSMLISSVASPRPSSRLLCSYETPEKVLLEVHHADITAHHCDVIVNAANGDLRHVGGLAKMIVDKGGKEIQKDCDDYVKRNGTLFPGQCYSGTPGNLQCKRLIHTVGPRWDNIDRVRHKKVLEFACANTLESAKTYNTIAIPAIGSGIFQVPKDICAKVMVEAALEFSLKSNGKYPLQEIHFVNNDLTTAEVFLNEFKKKFSFKPTFAEKLSKPRSRIKQEKGSSTGRLTDFPEMTGLTPSIEPKRSPSPADSITTNKNTIISVVVGDLSTHQVK